jgi:hypothetical protein
MTIEVLIPVRNATDVFGKTVDSLVVQTDKSFSVLISDNFSTSGQEHIERALVLLQRAGIPARKVQPPAALDRVEHWNWVHHESKADWLKPLFVGDWLDPDYVARLRGVIAEYPGCRYVFSNGYCHLSDGSIVTGSNPWAGRYNTPAEMQAVVLRYGMQFGPPSAAAYDRRAFITLGGYATSLPITADSLFYCTMAATFGAAGIQEKLCHMNIHAARFSISLPGKKRDTFREAVTYYAMLGYYGWSEGGCFPVGGYLRLLARETLHYLKGI